MNESAPKVVWRRKKTLRSHGRRAITPPRRGKTRGHVERRHGLVSLQQPADSHHDDKRETKDAEEQCEHQERKGNEDGRSIGEGAADQAEHQEVDSSGSEVHSEVPIHSGSVQGLSDVSQDGEDTEAKTVEISVHPFFLKIVEQLQYESA
jgi:hypothetical protein